MPPLQASLQFPSEPKVSADSKEFIARCLSRDPRNRPSVLQVRPATSPPKLVACVLSISKTDLIDVLCCVTWRCLQVFEDPFFSSSN